jgi:predicted transposase YdaD
VVDARLGKQRVDKLIQVRRRDGGSQWVLLHVEIQAQRDARVGERLFQYHYRILARFKKRTATLAVLADESPRWRPAAYEAELWGCRVRFEYPICKLQDFAGDLRALESDPNPIATVIVAHLVAQRTRSNMGVRRRFKGELARRLYDRGWTGVEVLKLFRLIDWLLRLPRELEAEFREDLIHFEKERQMPYVTSIERMGREEGRQEGRQEGRKEGRQEAAVSLLIRLARKRFPGFGPEDEAAIRQRPLEDLESLAEALLDFQSIADLRQWVGERSQK